MLLSMARRPLVFLALSKKLGFIEYEDDDFKADSNDIFFKLNIDISN